MEKQNAESLSLSEVAKLLHAARTTKKSIQQLSKQGIVLDRKQAYEVQELGIKLREQAGEKRIGLKMGLTSEGKRKQMNLDSPLFGELTNKMQIECGATFDMSHSIHPKIEPEVAFLFHKNLKGDVTREQVLEATSSVCACLEILDSRYEQFKYFSMEDVIADNSSSSHFILGPWKSDFKNLDLKNLNMKMSINSEVVQSGLSSEISGDPVVSIIEQCRLLALSGREIEKGTFVLAGAATAAVALEPGQHVSLSVDHLPICEVRIS